MGLDFKKPEAMAASMPQTVVDVEQKNEVAVVEEYSIVDDRKQMTETLVGSQEVDNIASQIEVYNLETIVTFGGEVAENISKASDVVLNSMNMSQINDSGELLKTLAKIMDQFDIDEIKENPGMFNKLFGKLTKQIEKILDKYHTMGDRKSVV